MMSGQRPGRATVCWPEYRSVLLHEASISLSASGNLEGLGVRSRWSRGADQGDHPFFSCGTTTVPLLEELCFRCSSMADTDDVDIYGNIGAVSGGGDGPRTPNVRSAPLLRLLLSALILFASPTFLLAALPDAVSKLLNYCYYLLSVCLVGNGVAGNFRRPDLERETFLPTLLLRVSRKSTLFKIIHIVSRGP